MEKRKTEADGCTCLNLDHILEFVLIFELRSIATHKTCVDNKNNEKTNQ